MQRFIRSPFAIGAYFLLFSLIGCLEVASLLCAFEKQAHAYVDPGSGFVFLQIAGSMMAGAFFYLRHRFKKLLRFTRKADQTARLNAETGTTETTP